MSSDRTPSLPVCWLLAASRAVLRVERYALSGLMLLLVLLVLLNVVTRYSGVPIYWIDEASVYSVVWLTFVGASVMTRLRLDFAVGMLTEKLNPRGVRIARVIATGGVLVFGLFMIAMCWIWLDPVGLVRHGFDVKEFAAETFNFLYTERTQTLEWPVWALQMVLPLFALTMTLHATANLLEDLSLAPRARFPEFPVASPDMVN
jgi:TRAP-type C4-dicarboxylate transport system permease small subunit